MAAMKPGVIALFDVDGTLTAPRKVWFLVSVGSFFLFLNMILNNNMLVQYVQR